jgi:hypothetical protein
MSAAKTTAARVADITDRNLAGIPGVRDVVA